MLTRGARNRVNRFPGNVQARDTRATRTRAYRRLQGKTREREEERKKGKERRSFEHTETDANNITRRDKKSNKMNDAPICSSHKKKTCYEKCIRMYVTSKDSFNMLLRKKKCQSNRNYRLMSRYYIILRDSNNTPPSPFLISTMIIHEDEFRDRVNSR